MIEAVALEKPACFYDIPPDTPCKTEDFMFMLWRKTEVGLYVMT